MAALTRWLVAAVALLLLPLALAVEYNNLADVACGQTFKKQPRIVAGENASPGEFPWLVSIGLKAGHFCGGTIVNKRFVLSAAHCFCGRNGMKETSSLYVTLGEHNLSAAEVPAAVVTGVKEMIVHEDFVCGSYANDVTLLELSRPIEWSDSVRPACLPPRAAAQAVFSGRTATVAGWGWLGESPGVKFKKSQILQKVQVSVIEDRVCDEWYESQGKATRLKRGQMCAGHEAGQRDACGGDSGGPLMLDDGHDSSSMVIGIVSSGIGCARKRLPGIYTRVSEFMPWIIENAKIAK